jgi:DNA-binding beta-propeller fold protein YncE
VTELRGSDGATLNTIPAGGGPVGIVFDGVNIWVVNNQTNDVTKIRANDGTVLGTFPTGGTAPGSAGFDGAYVWTLNAGTNTLSKF